MDPTCRQRGVMTFHDFWQFLHETQKVFDLDSEFMENHFGAERDHVVRREHLDLFWSDFMRDSVRKEFVKARDRENREDGCIPEEDFWRLWRNGSRKKEGCRGWYAYADVLAMEEAIERWQVVSALVEKTLQKNKDNLVSIGDIFLETKNDVHNYLLPYMELFIDRRHISLLFDFWDLDGDGYICKEDLNNPTVITMNRVSSQNQMAKPTIIILGGDGGTKWQTGVPRSVSRLTQNPGKKVELESPPSHDITKVLPPIPEQNIDKIPTLITNSSIQQQEDQQQDVSTQHQYQQGYTASFQPFLQNFTLAYIANIACTILLHPLDYVKTNMQSPLKNTTRPSSVSIIKETLQNTSNRWAGGLFYRGLLPPLLLLTPEKCLKLAVNDALREGLYQSMEIPPSLPIESFVGACAGACQVLITNPLEITKVRLMTATSSPTNTTFQNIVKNLGVAGLYRGAAACLYRDMMFGGIYFPLFSYLKTKLVQRQQHNHVGQYENEPNSQTLLLAGTLAALPASLLSTPFDVIKTHLHTMQNHHHQHENSMRKCILDIKEKCGLRGFWKGATLRMIHVSALFGTSVLVYDYGRNIVIGMDRKSNGFFRPLTDAPIDDKVYWSAFGRG